MEPEPEPEPEEVVSGALAAASAAQLAVLTERIGMLEAMASDSKQSAAEAKRTLASEKRASVARVQATEAECLIPIVLGAKQVP